MSASLPEDMREIESLHISCIFALVVQEFEERFGATFAAIV
jgi:hypothetical protein